MALLQKSLEYIKKYPQLFIILAGILLRLPLLFAPLTYSTDSWRQADTASIAYHFYVNGFKLLYPQIFWGGNGPGYVETEFQLYPFLVSILYYFFGEHVWLGKLVSLLFSIGAWVLFYQLAIRIFKEDQTARWALFFLVFSPLYVRYSVEFMPEGAVLFFYICALLFFVKWLSTFNISDLIIASVSTALAILVKPTSIHIGLVFALLSFAYWRNGLLKRWEVWASVIFVLLPSVLWYWHAKNLYVTYGNTFGLLSGGDSKFGNLKILLSPHFYISILHLDSKWVLGYGLILLFIVGLWIALRKKEYRIILFGIFVIGLYYMIVARYSSADWGIQYHVYVLPFFALATGLGVKWIADNQTGMIIKSLLWLSVLVFMLSPLNLFYRMLNPGNDQLLQCAQNVNQLVPASDKIIVSTTSVAVDNGVPNNYQEPEIFFYSRRYGWSLPADRHSVAELTRLHNLGGAYFVIYSKELLENNQELYQYLKANSLQVGPGIDAGCAIYHFNN